jgi:hypothetical protein
MIQQLPIYIPTYISSIDYKPATVLPRLLFYNNLLGCEDFYIEKRGNDVGAFPEYILATTSSYFPYFDNYRVEPSSSFPTEESKTLLFNNEKSIYGTTPTGSLYTEFYQTYVSLLYNPKTRLINVAGIIPFADYNDLQLNDIIEWRGNMYHLRAINNYSVKTGKCDLQLLGPIISDTFGTIPPQPATSASISWSFTETRQDGQLLIRDNGVDLERITSSMSGSDTVLSYHTVAVSVSPINYPISGAVTMSLRINGDYSYYATSSGANTTLGTSFRAASGSFYSITSSIEWNNNASPYRYAPNRFAFANAYTDPLCITSPVADAWYIPVDPNDLFSAPSSIFQNAAGTIPFTSNYVVDRLFGYSLPAPFYSYNSGSGAVGGYISSCL